MYREYSDRERRADALVHCIGLIAGLIAVTVMVSYATLLLPGTTTASLIVYGLALLAMLACSAAYNLLPTPKWRQRFRRFDQAAIFLKIAGTYTPFAAVKLGGAVGISLLGFVWTISLTATVLKLVERRSRDALDLAVYLILGWAVLVVISPLSASVTKPVLLLLALGGCLYSVGVVFHVSDRVKYQNVIWHVFVLAASACHFGAVNAAMFG